MINLKQELSMAGIYSFKVTNAQTGEERDLKGVVADDHPNMILDSGLDALGSSTNIAIGCRVGTGSTAVNASQTNLTATLASTTTIQAGSFGAQSVEPYFIWARKTFRFGQGVAAGNLTEVGVYSNIAGNPLFSRALILDAGGNPTTLTILADEYLDVTYELRIYQNTADQILNLVLLGNSYQVTVRPANITTAFSSYSSIFTYMLYWYTSYQYITYNGDIGTITNSPSGSSASFDSSLTTYVNGSYERTAILSLGLNDSNLSGGIKSLIYRSNKGNWQLSFNPAIPKDNYKTLVLNLTISWARKV